MTSVKLALLMFVFFCIMIALQTLWLSSSISTNTITTTATTERHPVCFEVNEWVFDKESQLCLVRFRRTRVSATTGAIVSGKSMAEIESRARCNFNRVSRSIEDDCWKYGTGLQQQPWVSGNRIH